MKQNSWKSRSLLAVLFLGLFVLPTVFIGVAKKVSAQDADPVIDQQAEGQIEVSPTPSDTETPTPSVSPSPTETPTPSPSVSPTPSPCVATGGFESPTFSTGSVDGQDGWMATGPYDQAIVANTYGYSSFGCQSLRVSDAITSGSFGDWIFAKPLANGVGESDATAGTYSVGATSTHFEAQFDIASANPQGEQSGLHVSVSPDRGDGSRMSYLRFEDSEEGINVFFDEVIASPSEEGTTTDFVESQIASGLDRTIPHTVKLTMDVIDGPSNDVVNVYIDGALVKTGTSWEDYYRYDSEASAEQSPRIVKTIIIQARGEGNANLAGKGFLFDNVSLSSDMPVVPTPTPAPTEVPPGNGGGAPWIPTPTPTPTPTGEVLGASTTTVPLGSPANPIIVNLDGSSTPGVILACPPYITSFIKFGATNNSDDVKRLQTFLNTYQKANLPVTGFYGPMTRKAVIKFQLDRASFIIKPWIDLGFTSSEASTGYVYKTTQWQVNSLSCPAGTSLPAPILP